VIADSVAERFHLAQKLLSVKQRVAQAISDELFVNHPEWELQYGERGRQFCTADACFHLEFLAGAIEADSPPAFAGYSQWTARMLGARGIAAHTLEANLAEIEKHLATILLPEERAAVLIFLEQGREACRRPESSMEAQPSGGLKLTCDVFLAAILAGQRQAALNVVDQALLAGHRHEDIYVDVFAQSLHRVGKLWELNKISVAQEHMATSVTQYAIAAIYPRLPPAAERRGSMIVTGVAGELHQIGANLVADTMEARGWAVRFLGTNLPHSSVIAAIADNSADVLCISATIVANLPSVVELVRAVRSELGPHIPKLVVGGAAFQQTPKLAAEIGAIEVAGLRGALSMLCE
jgi:MerR family transcriptional regulator, light-induced transcriptional regulator